MTTGLAVLRPQSLRSFNLTAVATALIVLSYLLGSELAPWSPKRGAGLLFGFAALFLFVFEMAYAGRRASVWPLRTARRWLQAHVYLGIVAFAAVVAHSGFRLPGGGMGWWLLGLSFWTTASGVLGVLLQKWVPVALSDGLRVEALYERIPELLGKTLAEADEVARSAGQVLRNFYTRDVRPSLAEPRPSWSYLLDVRRGRERTLEPFRTIARFVGEEDQEKVSDLLTLYTEKLELDAQASLQGILRSWVALHVPPAAVLMALVVVHVFTWVYY